MAFVDEFEAWLEGSVRRAGIETCDGASTVSAKSLRAWAFMSGVEAVFLRCGFVMGDFPTLTFDLAFTVLVFLVFLARSPVDGAVCEDGMPSRSMHSGELVVVPERPRSKAAIGSDWACSAGEVRGLK